MAVRSLLLLLAALLTGCPATPQPRRVRINAIKTDVIVYERESQADRQCAKAIAKYEKASGKVAQADNGTPLTSESHYRGCVVPPLHEGLYQHLISSLETIDNLIHELCHTLKAPLSICDGIHFDRGENPGRTLEIP